MVRWEREATPGVHSRRRLMVVTLGALVLTSTLALALTARPAGAVVTRVHGHGYGVTPITAAQGKALAQTQPGAARSSLGGAGGARPLDQAPFGGKPLTWHGGPVMHSTTTRVVYWDPNKEFTSETK